MKALNVNGLYACSILELRFEIRKRKSLSETSGSKISGYRFAYDGYRSPVDSQSLRTLMTLVCFASSLVGLQCGFGCGKQGWLGPHSKSSSVPSVCPVSPERRTEDACSLPGALSFARFVRFVFEEYTDRRDCWRFRGSEARDARCDSWWSFSGIGGGSGKFAGRDVAASPVSWWPVKRLKASMIQAGCGHPGRYLAGGMSCKGGSRQSGPVQDKGLPMNAAERRALPVVALLSAGSSGAAYDRAVSRRPHSMLQVVKDLSQ